MQARCYFCDTELMVTGHLYKIGIREEYICDKCQLKMLNRRRALGRGDVAS